MKYIGNQAILNKCRSSRTGFIISIILGVLLLVLGLPNADTPEMQVVFMKLAQTFNTTYNIINSGYWFLMIFAFSMSIAQSIGIYKLNVLIKKIESNSIVVFEDRISGMGFRDENSTIQHFDIPITEVRTANSTGQEDGINLIVNTNQGIYCFFALSGSEAAAQTINQYISKK